LAETDKQQKEFFNMKTRNHFTAMAITAILTLTFVCTACPSPDGGLGGNGGGPGGPGVGNEDGIGSLYAYVSTSMSDEYAYELACESASSARTAVLTPKEDGIYSLIVYDVNDGKVKGVSEGKIKHRSGGLTLKPDDTDEEDITVTINDGKMTEIHGRTNKGGNHELPGKVKPFQPTEGVSGGFRYATNPGNTVTITGYTGNGGTVEIPEQLNGKRVIGIGQQAFYKCTSLTGITIPESVTSIEVFAFSGYTGLVEINVSAGNTDYSSQDGVLYNKNKTTLIQYPAGKTTSSFSIPNGVTSVRTPLLTSTLWYSLLL
jgi:hypothetical protein